MKKSTLSKTSIALLSIAALFGGANLTHADSTPVQNASEINNVTKNVVKNDSALMSESSTTPTNGASFSSAPAPTNNSSSSLPTDAYYPTAFPTYTNPSSNTLPTAPSYYAPKDSDSIGNATTSPTSSTGNTTAPSGSGQTATNPTSSNAPTKTPNNSYNISINYIDENGNVVKSRPFVWAEARDRTLVPSGYQYASDGKPWIDKEGNWLIQVWSDAYYQKNKDALPEWVGNHYTKNSFGDDGDYVNPTSSSAPIAYPDNSNGPSASMVLPNTPATMSPTTPTSGTSTPTIITPTSPTGNSSLPTSQPTVSSMTSATTSTNGTSTPKITTPTLSTSPTVNSSLLSSQPTVSSMMNLSTTNTQATPTSTQPTTTLIRSEVIAQKITPVATNVGVNSSINRKSLPITGDSALISDELSLFGLGLLGVYTLTRAKIKKRD